MILVDLRREIGLQWPRDELPPIAGAALQGAAHTSRTRRGEGGRKSSETIDDPVGCVVGTSRGVQWVAANS